MSVIWKPAVTVAAIIEQQGRFLLVEEQTRDGLRLNQPAGHLEPNETLLQAVVRETLEETAHDFEPTGLLGVYMSNYLSPQSGQETTYLRFAFVGSLGSKHDRPLDDGIMRTVWLSLEQLQACEQQHRSPVVLQCVRDYLAGQRAPLNLLYTHPTLTG